MPASAPLAALRTTQGLLMSAIVTCPCPSGPLLHAALDAMDPLTAVEDAEKDSGKEEGDSA